VIQEKTTNFLRKLKAIMVNRKELNNYCHDYLKVTAFEDYCPNGLQVEGVENINKIVSGVSAN